MAIKKKHKENKKDYIEHFDILLFFNFYRSNIWYGGCVFCCRYLSINVSKRTLCGAKREKPKRKETIRREDFLIF